MSETKLPENVTEDQRRAIQAFVRSAIVPLIEGVIVKKLEQAAIVLRDELTPAVEQASEGDALTDAATALVALIEGPGCLRWEDGRGFRLKDTDEWVRFYVAAKNATHQKNAQ